MNGRKLDISSCFTQLGLSISSTLTWKPPFHRKACISETRFSFQSPWLFLTFSTLKYIRIPDSFFSHVWGGAPKSSLHLLDKVQSKAIRFTNNPNLTNSLQSLSHRHLVSNLSIFYHYFHIHCSLKIKNIISDPMRRVRTTRRSTHSHPFQVTLPNL